MNSEAYTANSTKPSNTDLGGDVRREVLASDSHASQYRARTRSRKTVCESALFDQEIHFLWDTLNRA